MKYSLVPAILALTTVHSAMNEGANKVPDESGTNVAKKHSLWRYWDLLNGIKSGLPDKLNPTSLEIDHCIEVAWRRILGTIPKEPGHNEYYEINYDEEEVSPSLKAITENDKTNVWEKTKQWEQCIKKLETPEDIGEQYRENWWKRAVYRAVFADILGITEMNTWCLSFDDCDERMEARQKQLRAEKLAIELKQNRDRLYEWSKVDQCNAKAPKKRQRPCRQKSKQTNTNLPFSTRPTDFYNADECRKMKEENWRDTLLKDASRTTDRFLPKMIPSRFQLAPKNNARGFPKNLPNLKYGDKPIIFHNKTYFGHNFVKDMAKPLTDESDKTAWAPLPPPLLNSGFYED